MKTLPNVLITCLFLLLVALIAKFSVNVPFWDEWDSITHYSNTLKSGRIFAYLFDQQNEHRPTVFRLLLFLLEPFDGNKLTILHFLNAVVALGIWKLYSLFLTANPSLPGPTNSRWLAVAAAWFLISPMAWRVWTWGITVVVLSNVAFTMLGFYLLHFKPLNWRNVGAAAVAGIFATLSFANGLLLFWVGFLPMVFGHPNQSGKRKFLIFWTFATLAVTGAYLSNFYGPPAHPSILEAFLRPWQTLSHFFAFLGSPLSNLDPNFSVALGGFGAGMLAGVLLFSNEIRQNLPKVLPWLSIILFTTGTGVLIALSRSGFGLAQAMSPRYIPLANGFWISLLVLLAVAFRPPGGAPRRLSWAKRALLFALVTVLVSIHAPAAYRSIGLWENHSNKLEKALGELPDICPDNADDLRVLFPSVPGLQNRLPKIEKRGFVNYPNPLGREERLQKFAMANPHTPVGFVDHLSAVQKDFPDGVIKCFRLAGWAVDPQTKTPAKEIWVVEDGKILKTKKVRLPRKDIVRVFREAGYGNSGWAVSLSQRRSILSREARIEVFAVMQDGKTIAKLEMATEFVQSLQKIQAR